MASLLPIKPSGVYTVLLAVVPLPSSLLQAILPQRIYNNLLPVPAEYGAKEGEHIVLLQLGRQKISVPLFPFFAQEAKFEIPFVRHPDAPSSSVPTVYKHSIWTDNSFLATTARWIMGLRTEKGTFEPKDGPIDGKYVLDGKLELTGVKAEGLDAEGLEQVVGLAKDWWFGDYAGKNAVVGFTMTPPAHPIMYTSTFRVHLPSVRLGTAELPRTLDTTRKNFSMAGEWLTIDGLRVFEVETTWQMVGPKPISQVSGRP